MRGSTTNEEEGGGGSACLTRAAASVSRQGSPLCARTQTRRRRGRPSRCCDNKAAPDRQTDSQPRSKHERNKAGRRSEMLARAAALRRQSWSSAAELRRCCCERIATRRDEMTQRAGWLAGSQLHVVLLVTHRGRAVGRNLQRLRRARRGNHSIGRSARYQRTNSDG
eukprot:COSAG06_NODE_12400_length_1387_cov_0.827640_2_plen_167_part_00